MNTTLCYIENDDCYLMLHRTKKKNDINHDKWLGIGGKFDDGETPHECIRREISEETESEIHELRYRGIITFVSSGSETEYMHLFTAKANEKTINADCDEGELVWIKKCDITSLPIWEGDKIFFKLLETESSFFSLKLVYDGEKLIEWKTE